MMGTVSDVAGTFSATMSIKTENETKHVKPNVTFSPDDVGNLESINIFLSLSSSSNRTYQNDIHVKHESIAHGMITLNM